MTIDILSLQQLPQLDTLDLDPCQLASADGCELCSFTCCCTANQD